MEIAVQELSPVLRCLKVQIPAQEVTSALTGEFKKIQRESKIRGFRPGKAPLSMIERNYAPQALAQTAESLVERHYTEAFKQCALNPLERPELDFDLPESGKDFEFRLTFDVMPVFELAPEAYRKLKFDVPRLEVGDDDVDNRISLLRERNAPVIPLEDHRPLQKGDLVSIDYQSFMEDKPLSNGTAEGVTVELGQASLMSSIEEALLGAQPGDQVQAIVHNDDNTKDPALRNKDVRYEIKINSLLQKVLPPLDDEFAKSINPEWNSLDDLQVALRQDLTTAAKEQQESALRRQIVDQLNGLGTFELPGSLVKAELEDMLKNFKNQLRRSGLDPEKAGLNEEQLKIQFAPQAERKVRAGLVLSRITEQEEIKVEESDLDEEIARMAQSMHQPPEFIKDFYTKNNMLSSLNAHILEEKTLRIIKDNAIITEKDPKELETPEQES